MSEDRLDRLERIVESNARSIEALSNSLREDREEIKRERTKLYRALANMSDALAQLADRVGMISAAQSSLWEVQADHYRRLDEMDERHIRIIEILDRLSPRE